MTSIRRASPEGLLLLLDIQRSTATADVQLIFLLNTNTIDDADWTTAQTLADLNYVSGDIHPSSSTSYTVPNVSFQRDGSQIVMRHDAVSISPLLAPGSDSVEHALYAFNDGALPTIGNMVPLLITDVLTQPTGAGTYVVTDGNGIVLWETDY